MKTVSIPHRYNAKPVLTSEVQNDDPTPLRTAVVQAVLRDADLRGADLGGANLRGADLGGANLGDADLYGADLGDADLGGADLGDADLRDADLRGADLGGANLRGANLRGANLRGANLRGADLGDATDLAGAYLANAKSLPSGIAATDPAEPYVRPTTDVGRREARAKRAIRFREQHPEIPVIDRPDVKILALVEANPACFDQGTWHCGTTHCTAGHMVNLAGDAGYALERKLGSTQAAARKLYLAAIGTVPHFYGETGPALERLRERAAEQSAPGEIKP
jgi:hypothetical protein